jgi:hypothetical protein
MDRRNQPAPFISAAQVENPDANPNSGCLRKYKQIRAALEFKHYPHAQTIRLG